MKISGLGAEQIAAMAMLSQAKKSSKDKESPAFGIMMEAVLASNSANASNDKVNNKDDESDLNNLKPVKPQVEIACDDKTKSDMERIEEAIKKASSKYGIDEALIKAIIKTESNFSNKVTSSAGAQGVMQIMPANFKMLGITDGYNIEQNIDGGTKLFRQYLDKYKGDINMALMAYNGGPGTMQRRGVKSSGDLYKMPKETQNYVPKVLGYYKNFK